MIMKQISCAGLVALCFLAAVSCDRFGMEDADGAGVLLLSFAGGEELLTRSYVNLPDTSQFRLSITDSKGKTVYEGLYGDCPESLTVDSGSYNIKVVSGDFSKPAFDAPQFGDEQCVIVPSDGRVHVRLVCTQLNASVRLSISKAFLTSCPDASLFLRSDAGKLMYSYSEKRAAFFPPGKVSLVMNSSAGDEVLMVRELAAREMLVIGVEVSGKENAATSSGMSVDIDTSRVWLHEECLIGSSSAGSEADYALSVAQAMSSVGAEDVWVCGYVVGGDLTSASASFEPPFDSRTNILIGPRSSTSDKSSCLSVQLPSGEVRDALNLVDNPGLLGRRICLRGDVVDAYFGIRGVKNTSEYVLL